ncbi:MAG: hypothetical protein KKF12_22535 [Proteobacteria bacterium]|nr:hypothetical protein [Desulfobacula sp.]MBU4133606.1 hypothetical protein [Pseudomonadota bacterium]
MNEADPESGRGDMGNVPPGKKDFWDKVRSMAGVSTAVAVFLTGSVGTCVLERQQEASNRIKLFTELTSKKEDTENAVRKDMFQQILSSFLRDDQPGVKKELPGESDKNCAIERINKNLLYLDLISRNFHETLDIRPLFLYVLLDIVREIPQLEEPLPWQPEKTDNKAMCSANLFKSWKRAQDRNKRQDKQTKTLSWEKYRDDLKERKKYELIQIGRRITSKQMESLSGVEACFEIEIELDQTCQNKKPNAVFSGADCDKKGQTFKKFLSLPNGKAKRDFTLSVSHSFPNWNNVRVKVVTNKTRKECKTDPSGKKTETKEFWVGFFDFPLVDNTVLSDQERFAVVLDDMDLQENKATLLLLYFPASFAGLKEKAFYQQRIMNSLLKDKGISEFLK